MSFGYSVGDFVILIQLADKTRRQFLDAPDEFKAISDIVKSLSPILREIEDVWLIRDLNLKQLNDLRDIAQSCEDALGRLNEKLERYQELDSHPKELGGKVHKAWKRFRWNPEEIKKLQDDIIVHVNLLDAFHGKLFGQVTLAIEDGVDRLHRRQDDREHQEMLDWLTPIDFAPQQNEIIHRRQGETGLWLLQSNEFRSWINQQSQILFCPGIPGAGKTMMSAIVVDYLMAKYRDDPSVGIAYVFCNYQSQHEQTPVAILSSLLKQLASARPALPDAIKGLNKPFNPKAERPPLDEIVKALRATLKLHSKVFIVIDALDEYRVATGDGTDEDENYAANKEALGKLLSELFQLRTEIQVSLFATSRFETDITSRFEGCVSKEIRAHDHDILKYIDSRMPKLLRSQISKHSQLQEKIRNEILNSVDGMFLLARLHMDSLMSQPTVGHINRALVDLPRGQKGLDKTYDKAVERVDEQPEASRRLARNILSWVSHARRVLSVRELQHALAVHPDMADPDEDFLPDVEILGSICAGLVRVDTGSDTVQLVHKTTEEYFKRKAILPNAEKEITVACVTYLSFDALGSFARSQGERWFVAIHDVQVRLRKTTECIPGLASCRILRFGEYNSRSARKRLTTRLPRYSRTKSTVVCRTRRP
ncbi:uncharacterized protein BDZ99DRAFT_164571 [Mytilinidion resinicola]|uniref:NACHT domain-containing protein n=1 Tax=Mytilinidion resinicola TaxID=574789 RepID=A0A6A6Y504_9PEZI|nr:uncharacterized protein BDZ99DRAFT_164571 [Mytilinidion resinicola]KAF2803872.1 hypothetical protein BDZ99DRAFT_164571 [Mytilinidion resinicola]